MKFLLDIKGKINKQIYMPLDLGGKLWAREGNLEAIRIKTMAEAMHSHD